ncbi:hypothetical protein POTOM_028299 [Populus tomentosa]|uniref:MLO-like protein n=1 Tax=Populus tomentosa TaxID=118781 RepID=A0A8X8CUQ6_POPTO|nr:hypothetical protein POTOM_028299 [Populus tomentosa]
MHVFLQGKVSLVSQSGVHQRRIFILVLAAFHVIYSVVIIALAKAKMKRWKSWELETTSLEYQFTNDPSRFRFTCQTSFVKRHTGLSATPGLRWIVAFLRQFFASVTKVDYLTLRHGFINVSLCTKNKLQAHFAPNSKFNFHEYIKRSMEDDFKVVVGISIPLWICSIIFQLLNVYGWYTFTWSPFVPLAVILIVGAKLEIIIMEMAREIQDKTAVVKGVPVVEPSNKYFWFNRPDIILFFIHFTLFHMGSHMKKAIFEEQTSKAIKKWQKSAKERRRLKNKAVADGSSNGFSVMSADHQSGPAILKLSCLKLKGQHPLCWKENLPLLLTAEDERHWMLLEGGSSTAAVRRSYCWTERSCWSAAHSAASLTEKRILLLVHGGTRAADEAGHVARSYWNLLLMA